MNIWKNLIIILISGLSVITASCTGGSATTTTPPKSQYQLEYQLLNKFPDYFWCDPDLYPIAREGQEQANALAQYPTIRGNALEFAAILEHLNLPQKTGYTDSEKLSIYREHKILSYAVTMTSASDKIYNFSLRTGENQGLHITGTIDTAGGIKVQTQESSFNTCPICLAQGTLIDTPSGGIPVEQLKPGMLILTPDKSGRDVAVPIIKTSYTRVPSDFQVVRVTLSDGRVITASPGHPTADMRALGEYHVGDTLDRGLVVSIEYETYSRGATYDILPGGGILQYRANGILLMTTLNNY